MMQRLPSQPKSPETLFDVVLAGGSPWGFTLQGGSDFRSKLTVSKIASGGKADLSQSIHIGDEIVAINGIDCKSRAEAIELVRFARKNLKIRLRRDGSSGLIRQNGPEKKYSEPAPNLYHTAAEFLSSDFYSTYNVDRQKYAKITQNLRNKRQPIYDSMDNLSASHEDLLESYRQSSESQTRASSFGESNGRLSRSSTEIANGRTSPEGDMLRRINSLSKVTGKSFHSSTGLLAASQHNRPSTEIYGHTWSLRRFVSLPEGRWPPGHERTITSPGRIQRVTVKSTNILTSPQRTSPPGRDNDSVDQTGRQTAGDADWVKKWLIEDNTHPQWNTSTNTNARPTDYRQDPDRRISFHEKRDVRNSHLEQSQSRSRSFGGPTSYGMTVTTTGLKRDESTQPTRPPARSSFSNLMRDKPARAGPSVVEPRYDGASGRPLGMYLSENEPSRGAMVYATPSDTQIEIRSRRDQTSPRMTISESTSSIDSVGTTDSSLAATRRQGPAPPPRRSHSKLLSSFRTSGRRQGFDEKGMQSGSAPVSRISESASDQPKHTPSRSWPTDHTLENRPAGNEARQSWHVEPSTMNAYTRRKTDTSGSSPSSEGTHERKLSRPSSARCSSSVVIRSLRSSSSSSADVKNVGPTVYRSGPSPDVEPKPGENRALSSYSPSGRAEYNARITQPRESGQQTDSVRQPKKSRIEDTRILQQLMRDNLMSSEKTPSVKSMVQNFEVEMKQSHSIKGSSSLDQGRVRSRSFTQENMDGKDNATKTSPMTQFSSVDSLLEQRSPRMFGTSSREKPEISSFAAERTEHLENEPLKQSFRGDSAEPRLYNSFSSPEKSKRGIVTVDVVIPSPSAKREIVEESVEKVETSPRVERQLSVDLAEAPSITGQSSTKSVPSKVQEERPVSLVAATEEHSSLAKEEDNEVFWDADDSLPPPPPMSTLDPLETSQDSLPLPSPPREVLVEFPNSREKYEVNNESLSWTRTAEIKDIGERDTASFVEPYEDWVEKPEDELSEREKSIDNLSAPAVETSTTSGLSSRDLSPTDSNIGRSKSSPPPPLVITSTPTKDEPTDAESNLSSSTSPFSLGSNLSTPGSRPSSVLSPKLEALDKEKAELVESMNKKINDLRSQMNEIKDEIDANEELGRKVTKVVEGKTSPAEFSKYQLFTGELNKIIGLLLSLTQRMHRYEMLLNDLDMSEEAERHQRDILLEKIEKVTMQHEEACMIKEVNDKRGENVSKFLENCLEEEEYADFQYYIDMKTQLALMHAEIRDKVKMGEERLNTLNTTKIDWSIVSLS